VATVLAVLCALALAGAAMSIVAFFSSKVWIATADRRVGRWQGETGQALRELQCRLDALASEVHEMEPQAAVTILPAVPRPGMNLSKRSQALRMHRRGETPDQIAQHWNSRSRKWSCCLKYIGS
jgi:hypothetical protein